MQNIVIYNDGELNLNVSVEEDTVWLNRFQLSELFHRDIKTIGKHINNIFKEEELEKYSVVANFATTAKDGKVYDTQHYNLDVIISVGYRVKSKKGVMFRQWATKTLKNYILNGYVINEEKLTQKRLALLEADVNFIKSNIKNNNLELKQGIFYNGEIFDAYVFVSDLIKSAKSNITLIDNYINDKTLTLFSKNPNIKITIYTQNIPKQLKLDIEKYNKQYHNLEVKITKNFHDRFLILDEKKIYHIGASLKDLGSKVFAFSQMQFDIKQFIQQL